MTLIQTLEDQIEAVADHLLDAAPIERAALSAVLDRVFQATRDIALMRDVASTAEFYARGAAERAYLLGIELGKEAGRGKARAEVEALGTPEPYLPPALSE